MEELTVNLHMHTTYSDGTGSHRDIGEAALKAGVDVVIVTDHNILVEKKERYFTETIDPKDASQKPEDRLFKSTKRRVLMLIGEEIHDQARDPQKNHLLVFNARRELATFAHNPQNLIDNVRKAGGICFLAHPKELACPPIKEDAIDWVDWSVQGYTGIELWNGLSEFKVVVSTYPQALFYALFPHLVNRRPQKETLQKWDELLASGKRVVAIGGSDAHALHASAGPIKRTIYPYEVHFRTVNTHLITTTSLTGDLQRDSAMIYEAMQAGHAFVGLDLAGSTRGFRFSAKSKDAAAIMGDEIRAEGGITFQIKLPDRAECFLLRNGEVIKQWKNQDLMTHITAEPGVYRVEAYRSYLGIRRGWIYSNPIYVR